MLLFAEKYVSREGIYVEHGHQYAEQLNRWDNFDDPRDRQNPDQIVYPPGSRFVIDFFNAVERGRVWTDSLKPLTALVWYSLQWDFSFAAQMLLMLARSVPTTRISDESKANEAIDSLHHQLSDASTCQSLSNRYRDSLDFRREFHTRAGRLLVPAVSPPGIFAWPPSPTDESAIEIARAEIDEIQASMRRVARRVAAAEEARVIVFGHTHRPCLETLENNTTLVNSGTWGWLGGYDPTDADAWHNLFTHSSHIMPHHQLTYTRVDYDAQDVPHAQLLDFAQEEGKKEEEGQVTLERVLSHLRRTFGESNL